MESKYVIVTPEKAKEWLARNKKNRPVKTRRVMTYASDMKAGRWKKTPQGVIFDDEGDLMDGQHRLMGIVEAGVPVEICVTQNAPKDIRDVLDQGCSRTASDILSWMHPSWTYLNLRPAIAVVIAEGAKPNNAGFSKTSGLSNAHKIELTHRYRPAIDWVLAQMSNTVRGITTAPVMGAICRAWMGKYTDKERLAEFCKILVTGMPTNTKDDTAAVLLRNWLLTGSRSTGGGSHKLQVYRKTQRALQAFLAKEKITKLYESAEDLFPITSKKAS